MSLPLLRRRIDLIDLQLLRLLNRRARLALEIGRIKHHRKWPVYDVEREAAVLRHVIHANSGPLSPNAVRHVFQAILRECRRRQRPTTPRVHRPRSTVHRSPIKLSAAGSRLHAAR